MNLKGFIKRYKVARKVMNKNPEVRNQAFRRLALDAGDPDLAIDFLKCDQFDKDLINVGLRQELLATI